jgi:hypothetical protein
MGQWTDEALILTIFESVDQFPNQPLVPTGRDDH